MHDADVAELHKLTHPAAVAAVVTTGLPFALHPFHFPQPLKVEEGEDLLQRMMIPGWTVGAGVAAEVGTKTFRGLAPVQQETQDGDISYTHLNALHERKIIVYSLMSNLGPKVYAYHAEQESLLC